MRYLIFFVLSLGLVSECFAFTKAKRSNISFEVKIGIIEKFLTNSSGEVSGFILQDGTRVNTPGRMAANIFRIVATEDIVTVKGYRVGEKIFNADTVINSSTAQAVDDVDATEQEMAIQVASRRGAI